MSSWPWVQALVEFPWGQAALWLVVMSLVVMGFIGTVIPALPGVPLIFLGILLAGWIGDFESISWGILSFCAFLTLLSFGVDWVAQMMGAKKAGATKYGIAGSLIGTIFGLPMGIIGIFIFPLIGAFIGEYIAQKNLKIASSVGWATWLGMIAGAAIKLSMACVMVGLLVIALW